MNATVMLTVVGAIALLFGCSERPSDPAKMSDKEKEILERAKRAVAQYEDWEARAEYKIERRGSQWQVTAWRVEHPEGPRLFRHGL